jgi:S-adenosylmethionine synthetase
MHYLPLLTSESVSAGHPDKICDQISDAILDACLAQDPRSRVAVETGIKSQSVFLFGEITSAAQIDPAAIARQVLIDIGYDDPAWGIDPNQLDIIERITQQSREIGAGVGSDDSGAGDQGLMFGYATADTPSLMPLPIDLAHRLMRAHDAMRRRAEGRGLGPDAKAQVTVARSADGTRVTDVVLSSQHREEVLLSDVRALLDTLARTTLDAHWHDGIRLHLNPAGPFTIGGPAADAGLTGRKIIVDSYGGAARHGGGAFSGKDPTKVDRSAAYAARQLARDIVARGWARACEVQVAYAIGEARPVSIAVAAQGLDQQEVTARYAALGLDLVDLLRPENIIARLGLRAPIYRPTASFGHFGKEGLPWEEPIAAGPAKPATHVSAPSQAEVSA